MPLTPGMLSTESPIRPSTSTTCAGGTMSFITADQPGKMESHELMPEKGPCDVRL
jgi:hypothetical protein